MKEGRDFALIFQINEHYKDLKKDMEGICTLDDFINGESIRRAVLFDFLQIGELFNHLSPSFVKAFNNKHSLDLIDIRNRIVHGYGKIKDNIIYNTITKDFDSFVDDLNRFSKEYYQQKVLSLIGSRIQVNVSEEKDDEFNQYQIGYTESLTTLDGYFQKVIILDESSNYSNTYYVIGEVHKNNEVLLVVSLDKNKNFIFDKA